MQKVPSKRLAAFLLMVGCSTLSSNGIASKATTPQRPTPAPCVSGDATVQASVADWQAVIPALKVGDQLQLSASGSWHWDAEHPAVGPAGAPANPKSIAEASVLIRPQSSVGTLIGKFGSSGPVFEVKTPFAATTAGNAPLLLMMNDAKGAFADNTGYITVHYSICPAPAGIRH